MSRTAWKRRMSASPLLQHGYAAVRGLLSRLAAVRRHPYDAARHLLSAWKHLPDERFGAGRKRRFRRMLDAACFEGAALCPVAENAFRLDLVRSAAGQAIRARYGAFELAHRVRMRFPRDDDDPERQGDLMVLKSPDPESGERGVLLVMFHETIQYVAATYDLGALAPNWSLVLETSNWGAQDARFLPYVGADLDVHVFAGRAPDYAWFQSLETNVRPIRLGSGEWVDPTLFQKPEGVEREYDVVMVAAWDPLKRHEVLFRALQDIRARTGRRLKTALIGYEMSWKQERIEQLVRDHGLEDDCTFFQLIPQAEVARLVAASGVSVLFSLQEGANRAVYESLFCDTPVVVSREHKGINLDHVNAATGLLADDDGVAAALFSVLDDRERFTPRAWAEQNIGFHVARRLLNERLRESAMAAGRPWTRDIVGKKNAPSQRYTEPGLYRSFEADYASLAAHLLPVDGPASP
jgi:glycosyltransferase involved in cell wall biosynthesis